MGIGDRVLRISMSTFSLQNEAKHNDLYSDDIEYKIVQHLLYKCDKTKIPYSRFQLIQHIDKALLERYIILTIIAFCCFIIAFEPKAFQIASFYLERKLDRLSETLSILLQMRVVLPICYGLYTR